MAMVDLLYSDNPKKRDEVVRLSSKLYTLLDSNFKRVNELIDCIHTYMPGKRFSRIKMDESETVKKNCRIIKQRVEEIETYLQDKVKELKSKVDKSLFDQLTNTDTKFIDRVRTARNIVRGIELVGWTVGSVVLVYFVTSGAIFGSIVAAVGVVAASAFAVIGLGVLIAAADLLVSAIIGAIEKKKLETAIAELKEAIRRFEPESDKFNRNVERVIIRIEDLFED